MGTVYVSAGRNVVVVCLAASNSPRHVPPNGFLQYVLNEESGKTGTAVSFTLLTIAAATGSEAWNAFIEGESTTIASVWTTVSVLIEVR
jgi:hypothetical protein